VRILSEDRLFPADPSTRAVARQLYAGVRDLPILSPHGHTNPRWFAEDEPFPDPAQLFIVPDHYVYRMLYSQGISMERLGIGRESLEDPRSVWHIFAEHYYLFRGTPTRIWLDFAFQQLFGLEERLNPRNADEYYDRIVEKLLTPEFRPCALYERFRLEVLATTDSPLDSLEHHKKIRASNFRGRIIPTFRPDSVVDPEFPNFHQNIVRLGEITGLDTTHWNGYLAALRNRRQDFKTLGCTATDHGHPTAQTADLSGGPAERLYRRARPAPDVAAPGACRRGDGRRIRAPPAGRPDGGGAPVRPG
jgi:glucuronate isomerase